MRRARRNPTGDTVNAALAIGGALALGGVVYAVAKPKTTTPTGYVPMGPMTCSQATNAVTLSFYSNSVAGAAADFLVAAAGGAPVTANDVTVFNGLTVPCARAIGTKLQQAVLGAAGAYIATNAANPSNNPAAFQAASSAMRQVQAVTPLVPGPPSPTGVPAPPTNAPAATPAAPVLPNPAASGFVGIPRRIALSRYVRSHVTGLGV